MREEGIHHDGKSGATQRQRRPSTFLSHLHRTPNVATSPDGGGNSSCCDDGDKLKKEDANGHCAEEKCNVAVTRETTPNEGRRATPSFTISSPPHTKGAVRVSIRVQEPMSSVLYEKLARDSHYEREERRKGLASWSPTLSVKSPPGHFTRRSMRTLEGGGLRGRGAGSGRSGAGRPLLFHGSPTSMLAVPARGGPAGTVDCMSGDESAMMVMRQNLKRFTRHSAESQMASVAPVVDLVGSIIRVPSTDASPMSSISSLDSLRVLSTDRCAKRSIDKSMAKLRSSTHQANFPHTYVI